MNNSNPPSFSALAGADYLHVVDARFLDLAARERLAHMRGAWWPTARHEASDLGADLLASAHYEHGGGREGLVRVGDGAVAHLLFSDAGVRARIAASTLESLDAAEARLRELLPERTPRSRRRSAIVRFWSEGGFEGPSSAPRVLDTVRWRDVAGNYPDATRADLERLVTGFRPGAGGKLLLWHGPPGTGKTFAIRALAWEWRRWCDIHYVTDPEQLLGGRPGYLTAVLGARRGRVAVGAGGGRSRRKPRWRLIVLEDSGELLGVDARSKTGQGLSRLLNAADGLLGQDARALVLVTTNEESGALHPAVTRPGRCAARVEFETFGSAEAAGWLAERGRPGPAGGGASLADLYARVEGWEDTAVPGGGIGFAAGLDG